VGHDLDDDERGDQQVQHMENEQIRLGCRRAWRAQTQEGTSSDTNRIVMSVIHALCSRNDTAVSVYDIFYTAYGGGLVE
jgi:hypothetical protein